MLLLKSRSLLRSEKIILILAHSGLLVNELEISLQQETPVSCVFIQIFYLILVNLNNVSLDEANSARPPSPYIRYDSLNTLSI